ncbi:hypothetical protein ACFLZ2_02065 [Candidatus Margulisiibacteriota bacterium]
MIAKVSMSLVKTAFTKALGPDYSRLKGEDMQFKAGATSPFQKAMLHYGIQDVYADAPARQHLRDQSLGSFLVENAVTCNVPLIANILQVYGPEDVRMIVSEDCKEVFFLKCEMSFGIFNSIGRPLMAYLRGQKKRSCYEKLAIKKYVGQKKQIAIFDRMEMTEHLKTCLICREWQHLFPIIKPEEVSSKTDIDEESA